MSWFKKKEWVDEVLPEIRGEYKSVSVRLHPIPCKKVKDGEKRKYVYPDFGTDFITDLGDVQLKDWNALKGELETSGTKTASVALPEGGHTVTIDITSPATEDREAFYRDLTDAIIDAFVKVEIKP